MDVSIIIINYNTFDLTCNTIKSVLEQTKEIDYEIILIDNNSPDQSGEKLHKMFPEIMYIQADSNYGTSKAFNIGYKNSTGKYILWLNPDVIIENNFIYDLFSFMKKTKDCGACGGNLLGRDRKPTHSFRKKIPSLKTQSRDLGFIHKILKKIFPKSYDNEYNYKKKPIKVGYITGADLMIRKDIIDRIGPFDEHIFMYAEETEFQYRLRHTTDYFIYSIPNAQMIHLEGCSFSNENSFNERRFKMSTKGTSVYMKLSYGNGFDIKYLKLLRKKYKRIQKVYSILQKKEKKQICQKKIDIINELLSELE